jgi:hypothetical protein
MTVSDGRKVILRQAHVPVKDVHPVTGKFANAKRKKDKWKKAKSGAVPVLGCGFESLSKVIGSLVADVALFDASPLAHEAYENGDTGPNMRTLVVGLLAHLQSTGPVLPVLDPLKTQLDILIANAQLYLFCDISFGILTKLRRILHQNSSIATARVYFEGATAK